MQHQPLGRILAFDHTASSKNPFIYVISQPVLQRVDGPILAPYGFIEKTEAIATKIVFFAIKIFRDERQRRPLRQVQAARGDGPVQLEAVRTTSGSRRAGDSDGPGVDSNVDRTGIMGTIDGPCAGTPPTQW